MVLRSRHLASAVRAVVDVVADRHLVAGAIFGRVEDRLVIVLHRHHLAVRPVRGMVAGSERRPGKAGGQAGGAHHRFRSAAATRVHSLYPRAAASCASASRTRRTGALGCAGCAILAASRRFVRAAFRRLRPGARTRERRSAGRRHGAARGQGLRAQRESGTAYYDTYGNYHTFSTLTVVDSRAIGGVVPVLLSLLLGFILNIRVFGDALPSPRSAGARTPSAGARAPR